MAVSHTRYAAGGTIQTYMTQLHSSLIAQGWTIEFADSDAIGTGSAASPAWSKTPATGVSAGIVVYRMPVNGSLTRWYIKVQMRWSAGGVSIYDWRITTATAVNAGTGALTGAGTEYGITQTSTGSNGESFVVVNENGFLLHFTGASANGTAGVERVRDFAGTVQDDVVGYIYSAVAATAVGFGTSNSNSLSTLRRNITVGERAAVAAFNIFAQANSAGTSAVTLNEPTNNVGYPTGPFCSSGGLAGMLRLVANMATGDAVGGQSQSLRVDGIGRQYYCMTLTNLSGGYKILYAQE
jgi:hypothetical protein